MFDSRRKGFENTVNYMSLLERSFGIHSSLDGIPSYRAVFLNSEAADTNGETITDNGSVGYSGTTGATTTIAGVVKDGSSADAYSDLNFIPNSNQDYNVTVTIAGTMILEVAAGETIAIGSAVNVDTVGRAAATGTATTLVALNAASGAGTADNPEYIEVLVR